MIVFTTIGMPITLHLLAYNPEVSVERQRFSIEQPSNSLLHFPALGSFFRRSKVRVVVWRTAESANH